MTDYPHITEAENFHGFGTVHFYESECRKAGQIIDRLPCAASDGTACIALLTRCPTGSPDSFDGLDIITDDEAHCLYSGAVRHSDISLTAELARLGYFFPGCGVPPVPQPQPEPITVIETEIDGVTQYALF